MTTATVSGDLGNLIGDALTFPYGGPARAYLVPAAPYVIEDEEVRLGSIELTLDENSAYEQDNVPVGDYTLLVRYYDPATRQMVEHREPYSVVMGS